jgi:outer membrane protein assembly factor BamB
MRNVQLVERDLDWGGSHARPLVWHPPVLWQQKTSSAAPCSSGVIKAGSRLYGSAGKKLVALETADGSPRAAWEQEIDGTPTRLIAADNKLFVATAEGGMYCFGEQTAGQPNAGASLAEARSPFGAPTPLRQGYAGQASGAPSTQIALEPSKTDHWTAQAKAIGEASGAKAGYCLVLGLTEGRLIEELLKQTDLHVLGVDADARKVDGLRRKFDAAGYYGARLELFVGTPVEFPCPPYLASLIVSEDAKAAGLPEGLNTDRLFQALHPYGGTLCLNLPAPRRATFEAWARGAGGTNAAVRQAGNWSLLVRDGPLPGSAPWTHDGADAANTYCSQDDVVQAPLGFLWYGDQSGCGLDVHAGNFVTTKVNGGRVYVLQQQRPRMLFAYDAFTGRFLWKNDFKSFYARMAALADGVYLATEGECRVFDPASGQALKTFTFNAAGATTAKELYVDGDVILIACSPPNEQLERTISGAANDDSWMRDFYDSTTLVCLDRKKGTELWRRQAQHGFRNRGLALGAGMVFCVDSVVPPTQAVVTAECDTTLLALEARTGKEVWSTNLSYAAEFRNAKYPLEWRADWVAYAAEAGLVLSGRSRLASALGARTGRIVWDKQAVGGTPLMIQGQTFLGQDGVQRNVATGAPTNQVTLKRSGCNYAIGSKRLVTVRGYSAGYAAIEGGRSYELRNVRSGCRNSLIPADGLLNAPNYAMVCGCGYAIRTSYAMVYMPEVAAWSGTTPVKVTPPPALPEAAPAWKKD